MEISPNKKESKKVRGVDIQSEKNNTTVVQDIEVTTLTHAWNVS
jgi:hypothetical protein